MFQAQLRHVSFRGRSVQGRFSEVHVEALLVTVVLLMAGVRHEVTIWRKIVDEIGIGTSKAFIRNR
jgi:hypothetical protein